MDANVRRVLASRVMTLPIPEPPPSEPRRLPARAGWTRVLPFAPEGLPLLGAAWAVTLALALVPPLRPAAVPAALFALFTTWFFRDPERTVPADPQLVVAPADGRVSRLVRDERGLSVSIFLSVFDVHVNRAPVGGIVRETEYKAGQFINAMKPECEDVNERLTMTLDTPRGRVEVIQVAGLIARRIICRARPGDRLEAGERYGLIRFGSTTVVRLPASAEALVALGGRVTGGVTPIARWSGGGPR